MTTEQQFNCVFCKESFCSKEDLQIHFRKHGDPNFNKSTKSKTRFTDSPNSDEKFTEDNEMVGCDVCDEVFPTISKAITHKHKVHPEHETKYFCPFCGKLFTMKHLYNKHIQTNHDSQSSVEKSDFHCDSCEVMFYVPSAMMYHNKFFHRQDPDLPGIGGSKKVKLCSQEMIQIYYCAFCGEEYNNKINLQKHIGEDHADENQRPTDILKCPLCEAMFYHLDAYELHLMFHTTEDVYSENNEMADEITEFSLETVPPIAEKIEEEQDSGEPEGMENFLQLLLDEPEDNSEKIKTKKHKKHKKSKKAAITLDEFLNMNKDVFGDGLDVQGIEEVPTQVVLKKIQGSKTIANKKTINADINKLKKQGITVKTKSGNNINPIINRCAFNKMASFSSNIEDKKQNVIKDPEDLLSKLMRQGNSQIKIVKRSANQIVKDDVTTTHQINDPETVTDEKQNNNATNEASNSNQVENKTVIESDKDQDNEDGNKEVCNGTIELGNITTDDNNANDQLMEDETSKNNNSDCSENDSEMLNKSDTEKLSGDISKSMKNGADEETSIPSPDKHDEYRSFDLGLDPVDVTCNDKKKDLGNECSSNKTIGALKHLSHLITIKPVKMDKSNQNTTDDIDKQLTKKKDNVNISDDDLLMTSKQQNTSVSNKTSEVLKNLNKNLIVKSITNNSSNSKSDFMKEKLDEYDNNANSEASNSIIKTMPVSKTLSMEPSNQNEIDQSKPASDNQNQLNNSSTTQQTPNKINQNDVTLEAKLTASHVKQEKPIEKGIDNEIEIFNIDDSDSEDDTNKEAEVSKNVPSENTNKSSHLQNVLQNLGSNITIKSSHQKTNEIKSKNNTESQFHTTTTSSKFKKVNKPSPAIQKSINLQNTLKNLGSNITIKSKNTSSTYSKEEHTNFDDEDVQSDQNDENDSDSEEVGKVKITEITEEANNDLDNESHDDCDTNAIVQSPEGHASDSDNQSNADSDFDGKFEESLSEKPDRPVPASSVPDNVKCLNKDLVIKSINDKRINPGNAFNTKISTPSNNSSKSTSQAIGSPNQLNTFNRKTSTSANEVNTVKTVKKYQTETVIQEITTVTRTIRTVNESSNETFVQTGNQTCLTSQKFSRNLPSKEHQGKIVRHATPTVGTKVRSPGNVRPCNTTPVRTPNQIVPIRSISNTIPQTNQMQRKTPGMQIVRNIAPPMGSPQRLVTNKLKMSPHVMSQTTMKRSLDSNSSIVSGIKKSKEFNVSMPTSKSSDTPMEQFSASTSKSEFSNVTKIVKGKSLVSTTQRSEVSTQQQLSRLSNMSGLKIMKTSTKQLMDIEEKCEVSASKRNTLEALEKLQKQGLLIKKPRVEIETNQQECFSESDDDNFEQ